MVFVKKGAPKVADSGTRPGLSGQTLVSTGLADFDKLLGGGLPLGTVTILLEDSFTQHHTTLLKYFLAEGAAHNHALLWAAGQAQAKALPQKVTYVPKEDAKEKQQESEDVQLRIAWQYRRYIRSKQKAAAASSTSTSRSSTGGSKAKAGSASSAGIRDWCHNFDLTKPVLVQDLNLSRMEHIVMDGSSAAQTLVQSTQAFVQSLAEPTSSSGNQASNLVPSNPHWPTSNSTLGSANSNNPASGLMPPNPHMPSSNSSANGSNTSADLITLATSQSPNQLASPAGPTEPNPQTAAATSSNTGSVSSQHRVPAPTAGVAGAHKSVLHTLDSAQSEAALARLSLSDGAAASGAAAFDDKQDSSARPSYGGEQAVAGPQTASIKHHTENAQAAPSGGPITAAGLASLAQQQLQQRTGRVAVQSLGGLDWGMDSYDQDTERQLFTAVVQLKALVRGSRCAAMLSFPAGLYCSSLATRLTHLCDTVIGLEAVRDNSDIVRIIPDAASCCGLLHLQKLPSLNALGPPIPEVTLFLIRHKRRRIAIQAVRTDPDAEAAEADGKSAAASLCGGPPKADKPFDF